MPKQNGKRKSPSVERQLALALVAVLDDIVDTRTDTPLAESVALAHSVLKSCGYENLESIPSRKRKLDAAIKDAMAAGEWDKVGRLSAEMKRAERGLPPLTTEKKARKPRAKKEAPAESAPKERKLRKKKDAQDIAALKPAPAHFARIDGEDEPINAADTILCSNCEWKGKAEVGNPCPGCGYLLK